MAISPKRDIQKVQIEGEDYVLIRAKKYQELLEELESIDTALEVQRTRTEASEHVVESLLSGRYTPEQMNAIFGAASFGRRLQVLRQIHNLNQEQLAEISDVSQATISKLENDKVDAPAFEAVHKVLTGLKIPDAAAFEIYRGNRTRTRGARAALRTNVEPTERAKG